MAGAKKQHEGGTGGRVNEPPGMDGRKSERSIVPMSPGNQTRRDPEEGRGRQGMEPVEGKMARALDLGTVSTTLHRIAELGRPAGAWRSTAPQRTHVPEEPDAGIPHVRICGGPGRATARVYPTPCSSKRDALAAWELPRFFRLVVLPPNLIHIHLGLRKAHVESLHGVGHDVDNRQVAGPLSVCRNDEPRCDVGAAF
jgi:hypothetical protein